MRILLDIDGVMVPVRSWKSSELLADGFAVFSSRAVANLQRIIAETSATIVLTTSHKGNFTLAEWESIFSSRGITAKIDMLDHNTDNLSRKDEILNWLKSQLHQNDFVIIDDDTSLNDLPQHLKDKLILTSPMIGLSEDNAAIAIEVLHNTELTYA